MVKDNQKLKDIDWDKWKREMDVVLESKAEEWFIFGYGRVSKEDVWNCFMAKLPRIDVPSEIRFHWITAQLFHLKANDYMNWLTLQAYKAPNLFSDGEPLKLSGTLKE
ncbi:MULTISPECIES: post-transcriptional regulator [Bacillaceae]|uniref:Post-transcriptional regulator n=1 Tax=Evansella alkalicola TaxID=745819 RepID=A0ABS6JU70_9BACI|nr:MULTISPECIES: post-transcriptional regulator [Bacillaceae]MBU9720690.1 post-transcriptional regulator [Bacillus alkalicola]